MASGTMERKTAIAVIATRDGSAGVGVLEFEGQHRQSNSSRIGLYLSVLLEPKGRSSRVVITLDDLLYRQLLKQFPEAADVPQGPLFQIAVHALGDHLDQQGIPSFAPSGQPAASINGDHALELWLVQDERAEPSDQEVFGYIASKVYWGWRFGLSNISFTEADARRVGIPLADFYRVALAGDGKYWIVMVRSAWCRLLD